MHAEQVMPPQGYIVMFKWLKLLHCKETLAIYWMTPVQRQHLNLPLNEYLCKQ